MRRRPASPVPHADVVIVGSGPGGATLARRLARAGQRVVLLERGQDQRHRRTYGTYLGALRYSERGGLLFTRQGAHVIAPRMLGGATGMYAGCATRPPRWLRDEYGIELDRYADETWEELQIAPLPAEHRGGASTRLALAAQAVGQQWQAQPKFFRLDQQRAPGAFRCDARCMLGCRCGVKWSAASWVDDAAAAGAVVMTGARVTSVLRADRTAVGVEGIWRGRELRVAADRVVLAAGGLGTPYTLRASGIAGAGHGLAMDTTVIVYGRTRANGNAGEPPMTWSYEDPELGAMFSALIDPPLMFPLMAAFGGRGWQRVPAALRYRHTLGVMIKLTDEVRGMLREGEPIDKPASPSETERLQAASDQAARILRAAGADPASIFSSPTRGTHPSATARIDDVVDRQLQTELAGLYVCDASVFPRALGQPTVLTIICLAKRLADHLLQN